MRSSRLDSCPILAPRRVRVHGGFTLVELIMVIAILAILTVLALPRLTNPAVFFSDGFLKSSLAAVRYGQKHAIASGCDVNVVVTSSAISLQRRSGCTTGAFTQDVAHPSSPGAFSVAVPSGVAVTLPGAFYFDRIGRPRNSGGALLGSSVTWTVAGKIIVVQPETGFASAGS